MKHITRFEYGNTRGWWVRIRRKPNPCSKLFSDGKYGGKDEALEKALAWRDENLKTRPPLAHPIQERGNKQVKTGVPGLYVVWPKRSRETMPALGVSFRNHEGRHVGRTYSIKKWGLRKALWKACSVLAQGREPAKQRALTLAHKLYAEAFKKIEPQMEGIMDKVILEKDGE